MGGLALDIYIEFFFRTIVRWFRQLRAKSWPIVMAKVTTKKCCPGGIGCALGDITYLYRVNGEPYTGLDVKPFIFTNSAERYIAEYSVGEALPLRVAKKNPEVSLVYPTDGWI
jgi:hypothetical protein